MPAEFDPFFVAPEWGPLVATYFFLGGITGGLYFAAAWLDLFGDRGDQSAIRLGHLVAFPLILVCAALLVADLRVPLRFWHMIFQSERVPLLMLKLYSPMSAGSLILATFGGVTFLSFVDALATRRGHDRWLHRAGSRLSQVISLLGGLGGLALAGYTGWLLSVSNEPVWSTSPWLSALFMFSGVSTGIAALLTAASRLPESTRHKLEAADNYLMGLEFVTLVVFLVTLGAVGVRFILGQPLVAALFGFTIVCGLLLPLALHFRPSLVGGRTAATVTASLLALVGGFALRWAVLAGPQGIMLMGLPR